VGVVDFGMTSNSITPIRLLSPPSPPDDCSDDFEWWTAVGDIEDLEDDR
jgi:hypothetical protein